MKKSPCCMKALPHVVGMAAAAAILALGCASEGRRQVPLPVRETVPPVPDGAMELEFSDFFVRPIGPRELKLTSKLRGLEGKRVRIRGYMVHQERRTPGRFLLTARPVRVHEGHYGLAEDLPPTTVHVLCPGVDPDYTPRALHLIGRLRIGNRNEPDGRISVVRLEIERQPRPGESDARGTGEPGARGQNESD